MPKCTTILHHMNSTTNGLCEKICPVLNSNKRVYALCVLAHYDFAPYSYLGSLHNNSSTWESQICACLTRLQHFWLLQLQLIQCKMLYGRKKVLYIEGTV